MKGPLIGVTTPRHGGCFTWLCLRFAVLISGGVPVRVAELNHPFINHIDGLIVSGGTDIDPDYYHQRSVKGYPYDRYRDKLETTLIKDSLQVNRPILGICRGMQLINVVLGGNLVQEVSSIYPDFIPVHNLLSKIFYRKKIRLKPYSYLRLCLNDVDEIRVNSLHHQAVSMLGGHLNQSAWEDYGLIQAIESDDMSSQYLLGVQWHPEYLLYNKTARMLFRDFVEKAREASLKQQN